MQTVSTPLPADAGFCVVIPGFLSNDECRQHIEQSEARGFAGAGSDYPPSYRNNERQVTDDPTLARQMLSRIANHAPATLADGGSRWALHSVNERFRICRYRAGQQFNIHQDGVHHRAAGLQSRLTFMVYLTDGDTFDGGDTLFYSAGPAGEASGAPAQMIGRVRPRAGSLILFDHGLWHAGALVTRGVKHILRSDVLYQAVNAEVPAPQPFQPGHAGYVWTLARLAGDLLASGGRDALIRLWRDSGESVGALQGHQQSVLGLAALPGGRLASISRDSSLRLWDLATRHCTRVVVAHEASGLAVSALPDGTLATGGADALVKLWQSNGDAITTLAGHQGWVWSVVPLGRDLLASASEDGSVKIWDRASCRCLHTLQGKAPLRDVAVLPGGEHLVTADIEGWLTSWQHTGNAWRQVRTLHAHSAAVRRVRPIGEALLASAGEDNRLRIWRRSDHRLLAQSQHDNFVTDVLPLQGGGYLSCSYDGRMAQHHSLQGTAQ